MLIITGVGRCGTSLVMQYCKSLGLNVGNVKMIDAFDAGLEAKEGIELNALLIKNHRDGLTMSHKNIHKELREIDLEVIKDPQFLVVPGIISIWYNSRPDIRVLWLTRDPEKIRESLMRLPKMNGPNFRHYPEMVRKHEAEFEGILKSRNIPYLKTEFPLFLDLPSIVEWIGEATGQRSMDIWNQVIDKSKIHV